MNNQCTREFFFPLQGKSCGVKAKVVAQSSGLYIPEWQMTIEGDKSEALFLANSLEMIAKKIKQGL